MKLRDRLADLAPGIELDDDQITAVVQSFRDWLVDLAVEQDRKQRNGSTIRNIVIRIKEEEVIP